MAVSGQRWTTLLLDTFDCSSASFTADSKQRCPPLPACAVQRPFQCLDEPRMKKPEGNEQGWSGNGK